MESKYLGQVLTTSDYEWMVVLENICKNRSRWAHLYIFWGQEGEDPRTSSTFYNSFVQETLFFWIGDLVDYPQDREDPWRIPPQGGPTSGRNTVEAGYGGTVGITTSGRRNVRCEGI